MTLNGRAVIAMDKDVNMDSNDVLWYELPEVLNFMVCDDYGVNGFCYRPTFVAKKNRWVSTDNENFDWLDMNGFSSEALMSLRRIPSEVAILQRPLSWNGKLRLGEVIRICENNKIYTMQGFFNNETVWLEDIETRVMAMVNMARIVSVDGIYPLPFKVQNSAICEPSRF